MLQKSSRQCGLVCRAIGQKVSESKAVGSDESRNMLKEVFALKKELVQRQEPPLATNEQTIYLEQRLN